ncbi:MAG TPA: two-component regulator propeller domain-containing protein [Arachidicoccus sp.]|nr:two-component regulator propeller domain-containing protein [Arachidicoccus sp.]
MPVLHKKHILSLFLSLICLQGLAVQRQLQFTHLDINDGLIHNQVNCVVKDSKGFLWFGTPSGLSRYDGHNFINFRHSNADSGSLADNYITAIFNLPGGKLWIQSRAADDIFDPLTLKFNHRNQDYLHHLGLPQGNVSSIQKVTQRQFLFVYPGLGIAIYNLPAIAGLLPKILWFPSTTAQTPAQTSKTVPLADAVADSLGNIWAISKNGALSYYNAAGKYWNSGTGTLNGQQVPKQTGQTGDIHYRLFLDRGRGLWIYTAGLPGDLYYLAQGARQLKVIAANRSGQIGNNLLNNNIINAITQDDQGNIWVGTDHGGINLISKKDLSVRYLMNNQENTKSLAQNCIYCLYKDGNGLIWVGTYKKGVCYYNEGMDRFPLYSHDPNIASKDQSLPYEDVNRFVEDEKGNLWIGTNGGGLIYYDRQKGSFKRFTHDPLDPGSLCADVIVGLCYDSKGRLWIGTYYGGLDLYQNGRFTHYRHRVGDLSSLSDDRVWDIYEDRQRQIWIGTLGGGLERFDEVRQAFIPYPASQHNPQETNYILVLTQCKNGDLWAGTAGGIEIYPKNYKDASDIRHMSYSATDHNTISNDNINAIYEDSRGWVWIGTREGLNCYNPATGRIRRYTTADGLPDNTILTILEDQQGNLWMSTPSGLIRFEPPVTPTGIRSPFAFRHFDESDGLQGREFNEKSAFKTREGYLIFGGANGFNFFDPASIRIQNQTPPVVFTELQIGGKPVTIGEKFDRRVILARAVSSTDHLTLPYGASDFSISFMALGYAHSTRIKYAYRLQGFNDEWIILEKSADNRATYTNLDPGDYLLEVRSCNQDGVWNKNSTEMHLSILPPFWKSGWAYLIYFLALAGLLYLARSILLYRAGMRFQLQQQKQDAHRTHEMDIMKIRFFTNISHEFRTPLSLILAPIEKMVSEIQDIQLHKQLDMVQRNAKRLLFLVNQLLDFRKLEVQEIKLHPIYADLTDFIHETATSFTDIAEKKEIRFSIQNLQAPLMTSFDPGKMERILFNLLSNAFKFTPEHGTIRLVVQFADLEQGQPASWLKMQVIDEGIGIPKAKINQVFDRFFQHDLHGQMVNPGSGIGLSITHEFVRLHGGSIEVESEEGKGSCFTVLLPIERQTASAAAQETLPGQVLVAETRITPSLHPSTPTKINGRKKTILLVEDHEDFRFYLKDNLQVHFNIIEASNGLEGWERLLENKPDLIVSDIMMGGLDGLSLCRKIKKDPRTASIPIILLTAKASEQQQLEGFEIGANDYMTKPFNFEMLLARIQNLLLEVKHWKKESASKVNLQPSSDRSLSANEQFLLDAQAAVEAHLDDSEYSVEQLSQEMFVSRVTLYKKMVAVAGKTPLEFIRTLRIKKAAQYLEKGMNVAQAAYEVGFNNPKYFTKYFKQEYGVLPSEYAKSKRDPTD